MRKIFLSAVTLVLVFSCTPRDPAKVVKLVDSKIYYPQSQGLTSLSCNVSSPYIPEMFAKWAQNRPGTEKLFEGVKLNIIYHWSSGLGSKFVVEGLPAHLSFFRDPISEVFLVAGGEKGPGVAVLVMPPTEKEQLSPFKLSLKKEKGKLTVVGTNPDPDAVFRQSDLVVDPKNWLILEQVFHAKSETSSSTPKFEIHAGKRYPVKIETFLDRGADGAFKSLVELEYQDVQGFWLVKNLTYRFTKADTGGKVIGPVQIKFENCKPNQFISPQVFKGSLVQFLGAEPESPAIIKPEQPAAQKLKNKAQPK